MMDVCLTRPVSVIAIAFTVLVFVINEKFEFYYIIFMWCLKKKKFLLCQIIIFNLFYL